MLLDAVVNRNSKMWKTECVIINNPKFLKRPMIFVDFVPEHPFFQIHMQIVGHASCPWSFNIGR
jgi:hypothetical protein